MKVSVALISIVGFLQFMQASSTEDICSLPSVTGPCRASFPRWFYDTKTGKCSQFIYGGCDGNKNNFETKGDCEKKCDSEKTAEYPCFRALQKALGPAILVRGEPVPIHKTSYLPSCDHEGYFSPKQCDKSKGECWCVSKLGKEILNTRKQGKDVSCDVCSLTKVVGPCFAAFPRWFFNKVSGKCEQFIYGGCRGNGNNFEGEKECEAMCVPHKLRVEKAPTKCQKEALEATRSKRLVGRFVPQCNPDGSYHLIQCHPSTGVCWCSNPDGTKYPGTDVRGKSKCEKYKALPEVTSLFAALPVNSKAKCQQERLEATRSRLVGRFIPRCNEDGTYQLIQCHASTAYCWCAAPDGTKYPGTDVRFKQPNCDKYKGKTALSKCQREALGSTRSKRALVGRFIPKCNEDGSYHLVQCHGSTGYCWCSAPDGTKFTGTDVPPGKQINCDKYQGKAAPSKCQQEVLEATKSHLIGRYVPQCNEDGSYQLVQCHGSTGYCWCSAPDGTKFTGTDVPPGKQINCDEYRGKTVDKCLNVKCPSPYAQCRVVSGEAECRCPMACALIYFPVCGTDGKTYANECVMKARACKLNKMIAVAKQGKCEEDLCKSVQCSQPYAKCRVINNTPQCQCQQICTLEYAPVCGNDGKTYGNLCMMTSHACRENKTITVAKKGECGDNECKNFDCSSHPYQQCHVVSGKPQCQCQLACTREYAPVCGSDGKTYGTLCTLKAHACETNKLITVSKIGECDNIKDGKSLVKASYQEKQTQNIQNSSHGSSGSSSAIIALSVLAALCVLAVVGVVLVRRRRGSAMYGKLQKSSFTTIGEKQPLVNA